MTMVVTEMKLRFIISNNKSCKVSVGGSCSFNLLTYETRNDGGK